MQGRGSTGGHCQNNHCCWKIALWHSCFFLWLRSKSVKRTGKGCRDSELCAFTVSIWHGVLKEKEEPRIGNFSEAEKWKVTNSIERWIWTRRERFFRRAIASLSRPTWVHRINHYIFCVNLDGNFNVLITTRTFLGKIQPRNQDDFRLFSCPFQKRTLPVSCNSWKLEYLEKLDWKNGCF